jgi:hypothetical protein
LFFGQCFGTAEPQELADVAGAASKNTIPAYKILRFRNVFLQGGERKAESQAEIWRH